MKTLNILKFTAAFFATTSIAMAQPGGGQGRGPGGFGGGPFGGGGGFGSDPTMLLSLEPVQKELELSEEQKADLTKLSEEGRSFFSDFRNLSREEITKKLEERTAENKKRLDAILLKPQLGRLEEVSLQIAGAGALDRTDVAEKLKLTDAQKKSLADLSTESRDKIREAMSAGPLGAGEMQEKMAAVNKERKEKSLAVLTKEQREKFDVLQGKKFDLDLSQMMPRFGGPRGGGRGGPGGGGPLPAGAQPPAGTPQPAAGGAQPGGN
jgi:Spy/CpxP family protein refolding chaperone